MGAWDSGLTDAVLAASAAASDSTRWGDVLAALSRRFGATAAALHTPRPDSAERMLFADLGLPHDTISDYTGYWSAKDPWFAAAGVNRAFLRNGDCSIGRELCDWPELERLEYYNEFAGPTGVHGLIGLLVDDGRQPAKSPLTVIGLYRQPGLEEFSEDDRRALRSVHAPLQLALHAHWAMARVKEADQAAADAFAAVPTPLLVLDGDGMVLHANPAGVAMLARDEWVGTQNGRVVRLGQMIAGEMSASLRRVVEGVLQTHVIWPFGASSHPVGTSAVARLVPLAEDNACRLTWPDAAALLLIDEPDPRQHDQRMSGLARRYGLTQAETRLLARLAQGTRPADIALQSEVSIHTVRAHLRSLFDKTGVRRQSELVRLVGAMAHGPG